MEKKLVWKVTYVEIRLKESEEPQRFNRDILNVFQDGYLYGVQLKDVDSPNGIRKIMFPIQDIHVVLLIQQPVQE